MKRKENGRTFRYGLRFDMSYENCSFVELAKWCIHSDKSTQLDWLEAIFTLYDGNEERLTSSIREKKKIVITTWHTIKLWLPYACTSFFFGCAGRGEHGMEKKRFTAMTTSTNDNNFNDDNHIDNDGENDDDENRKKKWRILAANKCGLWMQFALPHWLNENLCANESVWPQLKRKWYVIQTQSHAQWSVYSAQYIARKEK